MHVIMIHFSHSLLYLIITGSLSIPSWPQLPVDPTLSLSGHPTAILSTEEFSNPLPVADSPSTYIGGGGPPISCKLVEKIRK